MEDSTKKIRGFLLLAAAMLSVTTSQAFAQPTGTPLSPQVPPALEKVIAESHEALRKILGVGNHVAEVRLDRPVATFDL